MEEKLDYTLLKGPDWGGCISADTSHDGLPIPNIDGVKDESKNLGLSTPSNLEDMLLEKGIVNYDNIKTYMNIISRGDLQSLRKNSILIRDIFSL